MGRFKKYLWAACVMTFLCWGIGSLIHNLQLAAQEDEERIANEARLQKLNIPRNENGVRYSIGNIGGQRVKIPPGIVNTWITYDGDPNDFDFDAKRKYKRPPASYESSIAQFGFKFRISDGALLRLGTQTEVDYQNDSKTLPIPWVYVISKSGEQYPTRERAALMDVYFKDYVNPTSQAPLSYSGQEYGLEVYRFLVEQRRRHRILGTKKKYMYAVTLLVKLPPSSYVQIIQTLLLTFAGKNFTCR